MPSRPPTGGGGVDLPTLNAAVLAQVTAQISAGGYASVDYVNDKVTLETTGKGFVTASDVATATALHKKMIIIGPTDPNPPGISSDTLVGVLAQPLIQTTFGFLGTGLTDGTPITNAMALPQAFDVVAQDTGLSPTAPYYEEATKSIVIGDGASTANNCRKNNLYVPSSDWSFGMEFRLGTGAALVAPASASPFLYPIGPSGSTAWGRYAFDTSSRIVLRNSTGSTTLSTSPALTSGDWYFLSAWGTAGTDLVNTRVRKMSDGSIFWEPTPVATGGANNCPDTLIWGRQSGSGRFNNTFRFRRPVFSTIAQELWQW